MNRYERIAHFEVTLKLRDERRLRYRIGTIVITGLMTATGLAGCAASNL